MERLWRRRGTVSCDASLGWLMPAVAGRLVPGPQCLHAHVYRVQTRLDHDGTHPRMLAMLVVVLATDAGGRALPGVRKKATEELATWLILPVVICFN